MDKVKCGCVILPCPDVHRGRAEPSAAADMHLALFLENSNSGKQAAIFGSLEGACSASTPRLPQRSLCLCCLPHSQPVSWFCSSFSPILHANKGERNGRGYRFPSSSSAGWSHPSRVGAPCSCCHVHHRMNLRVASEFKMN